MFTTTAWFAVAAELKTWRLADTAATGRAAVAAGKVGRGRAAFAVSPAPAVAPSRAPFPAVGRAMALALARPGRPTPADAGLTGFSGGFARAAVAGLPAFGRANWVGAGAGRDIWAGAAIGRLIGAAIGRLIGADIGRLIDADIGRLIDAAGRLIEAAGRPPIPL